MCALRSAFRLTRKISTASRNRSARGDKGREALLDCEHFFDGYKANRDYALECAKTALEPARAGSCFATPMAGRCRTKSRRSSASRRTTFPATARHPCPQRHRKGRRQLARGGARRRAPDPGHVERARRALRQRQPHSLIPTLLLKPDYAERSRSASRRTKLATLTHVAHARRLLNRAPDRHAPYVGRRLSRPRPASMPRRS